MMRGKSTGVAAAEQQRQIGYIYSDEDEDGKFDDMTSTTTTELNSSIDEDDDDDIASTGSSVYAYSSSSSSDSDSTPIQSSVGKLTSSSYYYPAVDDLEDVIRGLDDSSTTIKSQHLADDHNRNRYDDIRNVGNEEEEEAEGEVLGDHNLSTQNSPSPNNVDDEEHGRGPDDLEFRYVSFREIDVSMSSHNRRTRRKSGFLSTFIADDSSESGLMDLDDLRCEPFIHLKKIHSDFLQSCSTFLNKTFIIKNGGADQHPSKKKLMQRGCCWQQPPRFIAKSATNEEIAFLFTKM